MTQAASLEAPAASESVAQSKYALDNAAAAAKLNISPTTLATWRSQRRYEIPFTRVGRKIFYSAADIDAWLESRRGTEPNPRKKPAK